MRSLTLLAMTLLAAATASAQSPLTVGSATARPGETASGVIAVPDGADPGAQVPVSVVNGARPGPVLALVAGTHGYEYTSIVALPRVLAKLDPKKMAGAVILVHMANPPAFYERRIYRNVDGKNLNRVYPGNASGTQTERIAFALTRDVIDKATHLVDMHCGDGNESLWRYSYWQVTGDAKMDAAGKELALAFGLDHIVIDRERPKDLAHSLYTSNTAVLRRQARHHRGVGRHGARPTRSRWPRRRRVRLSVDRAPGHPGLPVGASGQAPLHRPLGGADAPVTGVWRGPSRRCRSVAEGTLLGRVTTPSARCWPRSARPSPARCSTWSATPPVSKGEPVAFVGTA